MKELNLKIDQDDLKALFIACGNSVKNCSFQDWVRNTEVGYESYFERQVRLKQAHLSFSQWVNGQIISLT